MTTRHITRQAQPARKWFGLIETLTRGAAVVAVVVFVLDYGFNLIVPPPLLSFSYWLLAGVFLFGFLVQFLLFQVAEGLSLPDQRFKLLMVMVLLGGILLIRIRSLVGQGDWSSFYNGLLQVYILTNLWQKFVKFTQYLAHFNTSPARFILFSFGGVILLGSGLLMLPNATTGPLRYLDVLFTATSAVCVTGLIVVDTATAFTQAGQLIILGLIQMGGLGIMTITAFFSFFMGQRLSGREQVLLGDALSTERYSQIGQIIRSAFYTTILLELIGALLLYLRLKGLAPEGGAAYTAFFHSVSAFCNAGFSTFSDSLMRYRGDLVINLTICGLIIFGGLGFETHRNLQAFLTLRLLRKKAFRFSLQTRLVLIVTAILLVVGTVLFWFTEQDNVLRGLSWGEQILVSFFQSVTPRTAGFNTVDYAALKPVTLMGQILLMFIGVGPISTGGGIKVTTFAILVMTVIFAAQGKTRVELFKRTIPVMVLYQTIVVFTMYLLISVCVSVGLMWTELPHAQFGPLDIIFEANSALGTVGLSTGVTSQLSAWGKLIIIVTMFLGRVGPFTTALAIGRRQLAEQYRYPEEKVQIG